MWSIRTLLGSWPRRPQWPRRAQKSFLAPLLLALSVDLTISATSRKKAPNAAWSVGNGARERLHLDCPFKPGTATTQKVGRQVIEQAVLQRPTRAPPSSRKSPPLGMPRRGRPPEMHATPSNM